MSSRFRPLKNLFRMRWSMIRGDGIGLLLTLVLAVLSWQLVNGVSVALYRQFESLGDPGLMGIRVAGPGLDGKPANQGPPPSHLGHTGYFWSERAFHYRCALMFAVDGYQDPAVLSKDIRQQYPAGVNAWREYTVMMEPVYGYLYRLAGDQSRPLVEFLLRLIPLIHVLLLFPLYAMARALGVRPWAALLGLIFYATCTMGFARLSGSLLLKENFALLCLMTFLAAHLWAWKTEKPWLVGLAGLLLIPTLASWHLNQFLFMGVAVAAALAWLAADPEKVPAARFGVLLPVVYGGAGILAGLTPSLFERGFIFSLPMALLGAWVLAAWLATRTPRLAAAGSLRLLVFGGGLAVFGLAAWLNGRYTGDYSHVFGLLVEKIRHGMVKPADPTALPFDVRVFWDAPFLAPTWEQVRSRLGFHVLLLVPAVAWSLVAAFRRSTEPRQRSIHLVVPLMVAAYLLIERLGVVLLLFGALAVALGIESFVRRLADSRLGPRWSMLLATMVVLGAAGLNLGTVMGDMLRISTETRAGRSVRLGTSDQVQWQAWQGMFDWIRTRTPGPGSPLAGAPASFLAEIGLSPPLLLYTGRPVVLNSQFENAEIRNRYREFLAAIYDTDEKVLWDFARRYRADYLVISRHFATRDEIGSYRYLAGVTGELSTDMTAVRLHFEPEGLRYFQPVYDNDYYRILRIASGAGEGDPAHWERSFSSWWHPDNFRVVDGRLADLAGDRQRLRQFQGDLGVLQNRQAKVLAGVEDHWRRTRGRGQNRPDLMLLHRQYVQVMLENLNGRKTGGAADPRERQLANLLRARLSEIDPTSGRPLAAALGAVADGPDGWLAKLQANAGEPAQYAACAQLLALAGRYDAASTMFGRAASFFTGNTGPPGELEVRLWQEHVWWMVGAGKPDVARQWALEYQVRLPAGSPAAIYFGSVAGARAVD